MNWKHTRGAARCVGIAAALYLVIGLLAFSPTTAHATPLALPPSTPGGGDVTTSFTDVKYVLDANPATGTLTATGYPDGFYVDIDQNSDDYHSGFITSSFSLTLHINRATGAPLGGTVSIMGQMDGSPGPESFSGDLLEGNITQFGFVNAPFSPASAGNNMEFLVNINSGLLLEDYYPSHRAGIILNIANTSGAGSHPFNGTFTAPFDNYSPSAPGNGNGFSDTFQTPIPEPSSFVLSGLALAVLAFYRWRRICRPT